MSPTWHRLALQQSALPPLLFQYTWTQKGYALYITDLTTIWSEELSHQKILKQAEDNATAIDPSEDQDQFEVLLVKIGEALRGDGGSATLSSSQSNELQLTTSSKLPPPLRPLKWIMRLSKQRSPSITDQLLLPLLRDEAGWESRQRFLLDQLKQKDWVLGKLFDKFEALGVDLGTVFPGAAGVRSKKGSTRSDVGRLIKGVAAFDEEKWLRESTKSSSDSTHSLATDVINELAGSGQGVDLANLRAPQDKWWTELPTPSELESSFLSEKSGQVPTAQQEGDVIGSQHDYDLDKDGESTASEEDEFQVKEMPPRRKVQAKKPAATSPQTKPKQKPQPAQPPAKDPNATASDTDSDSDSDSGPKAAPSAQRKRTPTPEPKTEELPQKTKARGGLGVIGGRKKKEKQPPPVPAPAPFPSSPPPQKTKVPSSETLKSTEEEPTPAAPSPKPKKTNKLGMIGGKAKKKAPAAPEPASPIAEHEQGPIHEPLAENKKGTLESKPTGFVKEEVSRCTTEREETAAPPTLVETEEQKTARKREELKRQLEEKSKAPKKKRRF